VVIGNSFSGQDISMELVEVAKEVHLSSKSLNITEGLSKVISKHENLHLRPQVSQVFTNIIYIYIYISYLSNTSKSSLI
jgi:cation diffusion facilitator CzcD-associated flavoprotein CzcO